MKTLSKTLTAAVWQHGPSTYRGTTLLLLLKLAALTTPDGFAFPSTEYLAAACGIKERNVQKITGRLKKDRVLKINGRKGRSNKYYLQLDALLALPLAVPGDEPAQETLAPVTPAQPKSGTAPPEGAVTQTPDQQVDDAQSLAKRLHYSITKKRPDAAVPNDWQTTWTAAMQSLLDSGHTSELIRAVARFALADENWCNFVFVPSGATGFAATFDSILSVYQTRKAA